jgi:hypothetical protein
MRGSETLTTTIELSPSAIKALADDIAAAGLKSTKTGVTFSPSQPIPDGLVKKLALASRRDQKSLSGSVRHVEPPTPGAVHDGGSALGGDSDWTWNKTTNVMTVAADILYTGVVRDTSDRRLKSNIRQLPSSLEAMLRLKPVSFSMNDNPTRTEYGLIAQDVEQVFPALVSTASDVSGTKSLNYIGLIAPTIKALQELKADNDNLRGELDELRREIRDLKNGVGYRRTGTR